MISQIIAVALLVLAGGVWQCDCQEMFECTSLIANYSEVIESKRIQACDANAGAVIPMSRLEPVLQVISKFLKQQPDSLDRKIPPTFVRGFDQARLYLRTANANLCNDNQIQKLAQMARRVVSRQVPQLEEALQAFCDAYLSFMETEEGKAFVQQINELYEQAMTNAAQFPTISV